MLTKNGDIDIKIIKNVFTLILYCILYPLCIDSGEYDIYIG